MQQNNNIIKPQSYKWDSVLILAFAMLDASLIGPFLGSMLKHKNISFAWIGIILSSKNLTRLVTDIPMAMLTDTKGWKVTFIISRTTRILSVLILLIYNQTIPMLISMCLYGLSMSSFYGKIDAYLMHHSNCKGNKDTRKILSSYFLCTNITILLCGTTATYLFGEMGYNGLCALTILTTSISLTIIPFLQHTNPNKSNIKYKSTTTRLKHYISSITNNREAAYIIPLLSLTNLIMWNSHGILNITLMKENIQPQTISIISTFHFACIIGGYSMAWVYRKINLIKLSIIITIMLIALVISAPMLNIITIAIFFMLSLISPIMHISYENMLNNSAIHNRNTIISISSTLAAIYTVILNIVNGFLVDHIPNSLALTITISAIASVAIFAQIIQYISATQR